MKYQHPTARIRIRFHSDLDGSKSLNLNFFKQNLLYFTNLKISYFDDDIFIEIIWNVKWQPPLPFYKICDHDDDVHPLLPNHLPEGVKSVVQRALGACNTPNKINSQNSNGSTSNDL